MNENMSDNRKHRDIDGNEYNPTTGTAAYESESSTTAYSPSSDTEKRKLQRDEETADSGGRGPEETAAKKKKTSFGFSQTFGASKLSTSASVDPKRPSPAPISIKLGAQRIKQPQPTLKKASTSVADVFNQSSDEEEEMPPEAKMRMRNIGRDTPTSAGPNSFGKTRQGFCDMKKVFERQLLKQMEELSD